MQTTRLTYCLLLALCLTACREMFYREVDFTLEGEQPMLAISAHNEVGAPLQVQVYHSFLSDQPYDTQQHGELTDAAVSVRVNSADWTTEMPTPQPLDTVDIRVTHPAYPTATARQIAPAPVNTRIADYRLLPNFWLEVTIDILPYHGQEDDGIGIALSNAYLRIENSRNRRRTQLRMDHIYSNDPIFASALNIELSGYYCGNSEHALYIPAAQLQQQRRIQLLLDAHAFWSDTRNRKEDFTLISIEQLSLHLESRTAEAYLYEQYRRVQRGVQLYPPSGIPEQGDTNIMQEILKELANSLGQQEPVPPYTNVSDGLGCFTLRNPCVLTAP